MRIAFTYNLKLDDTEASAEFDTQQTIDAVSTWLQELGHEVHQVEVGGPVSRTIARLEALMPDLVFNTAEGKVGRFREGFFPGVFEQLNLGFTGSDAYICTLTLDKHVTKQVLRDFDLPMARSIFVTQADQAKDVTLDFPLILKPNFEGSSKGITQDSIVEDKQQLQTRLKAMLKAYPQGILVEEFIVGTDVTVPFLEAVSPATNGVLPAIEYIFPATTSKRKYQIYDYEMKNDYGDDVGVRLADELPQSLQDQLRTYAGTVFRELKIRDLGRADFRLTPDGKLYFIEVNALPSLEPGAGIYTSATAAGLEGEAKVIAAVVESAAKRFNIPQKGRPVRRRSARALNIGFTYNEKRVVPGFDPDTDTEAEFDSPKTLNLIREAIRSFGHTVIDLEATPDLPTKLETADVDVVFNIAEGFHGRNREGQVPALLELLDIPYTGSDSAAASLSLDKGLAKRIVAQYDVPTPRFQLMVSGKEKLPTDLRFPVLLKPVAEGSSKGVIENSVVENEAELRKVARQLIERYRQGVLAEEFLPGREFTVAMLGETKPKIFRPMEIEFLREEKYPVYTYQGKIDETGRVRYNPTPEIDPKLEKRLQDYARTAFRALGCRDVARIDFRLDASGEPNFIECNPLPGLTPGWSDLCKVTDAAGMSYNELIGELLAPAIRRWKEKNKQLMMQRKTVTNEKAEARAPL